MSPKTYLLPALWLVAALTGSLGCDRLAGKDPVVLRLGHQVVRRSDFQRHLGALEARGMEAVDSAVTVSLLDAFIEERVLVLEARERGLVGVGASVDQEEQAAQRLLSEAVLAKLTVSQKEIEAYYRAHVDEFGLQEMAVVRQILVASANEARDIRRRLQKDPKNFEIMARTLSRSPEASQGGLLGRFARGELPPELDQVAFALAPRTQTEIVATPHGFHVLRVDERTPARVLSFEECSQRVEAIVRRRKQEHAVRQFVRDLLARAEVNHEAAQIPHHPTSQP